MIIMPFDTETDKLPDWKIPSDDPSQPHLVQLAALLVDADGQELESMDVIIRPDGWEWDENNEAFKVHGITVERAMDEGIAEQDALEMLLSIYSKAQRRVAFNSTFDNRILRIAMKRYFGDGEEKAEIMRSWKEDKDKYYCAMINARKVMGGKQPKLAEAYKYFTGEDLEGAHNAMADTRACLRVYQGIMQHQGAA